MPPPAMRFLRSSCGDRTWSARIRPLRRKFNGDHRSPTGVADHAEPRLVAEKHLEALLNIFHSDSRAVAAQGRGLPVAHAHAVVGHLDGHPVSVEVASKSHSTAID